MQVAVCTPSSRLLVIKWADYPKLHSCELIDPWLSPGLPDSWDPCHSKGVGNVLGHSFPWQLLGKHPFSLFSSRNNKHPSKTSEEAPTTSCPFRALMRWKCLLRLRCNWEIKSVRQKSPEGKVLTNSGAHWPPSPAACFSGRLAASLHFRELMATSDINEKTPCSCWVYAAVAALLWILQVSHDQSPRNTQYQDHQSSWVTWLKFGNARVTLNIFSGLVIWSLVRPPTAVFFLGILDCGWYVRTSV